MSRPIAFWSWRCDKCGEIYPALGLVSLKGDAEDEWRRHSLECRTRMWTAEEAAS